MRTPPFHLAYGTILMMAIILIGSGCTMPVQEARTDAAPQRNSRLAIIPFTDMAAIYGPNESVRGPATNQVFITGPVENDAASQVDHALQTRLADHASLKWSIAASGAGTFSAEQMTSRARHVEALAKIGAARGADAVLAGYLYTFRERRGGDYGVEKPAKVVMELVLLEVQSARVLWQKRYSEQQQPLSSNLMNLGKFFKRKGRWVTAIELASQFFRDAVPTIYNALPY